MSIEEGVKENFVSSLGSVGREILRVTLQKGFDDQRQRTDGELIALMHSELSEALEACRRVEPKTSEHIPDFSELEEEMADTIIRILHFCAAKDLRIGEAVLVKIAFNKTRPPKHGKRF